jgi:hypothetical protein
MQHSRHYVATMMLAPMLPRTATGLGGGFDFFVIIAAIGLLVGAGLFCVAIQIKILTDTTPMSKTRAMISGVTSFVIGLGLIAGGFCFHPNAPYEQNWNFLLGGAALVGVATAAQIRVARQRKNRA